MAIDWETIFAISYEIGHLESEMERKESSIIREMYEYRINRLQDTIDRLKKLPAF